MNGEKCRWMGKFTNWKVVFRANSYFLSNSM